MAKITRVLASVSDKNGLPDFMRALHDEFGVEIISTGGTATCLRENQIPVIEVSDFTGSPEMLGGRVKTLHPKIHGGLLGIRDDVVHQREMRANGIKPIDMLVCNLYPFEATIAKPGCTLENAIENIDIGGPAMVRSAAKNYHDVTVVMDPKEYDTLLQELRQNNGAILAPTNRRLSCHAFDMIAWYDKAIADYLGKQRRS